MAYSFTWRIQLMQNFPKMSSSSSPPRIFTISTMYFPTGHFGYNLHRFCTVVKFSSFYNINLLHSVLDNAQLLKCKKIGKILGLDGVLIGEVN